MIPLLAGLFVLTMRETTCRWTRCASHRLVIHPEANVLLLILWPCKGLANSAGRAAGTPAGRTRKRRCRKVRCAPRCAGGDYRWAKCRRLKPGQLPATCAVYDACQTSAI